MIELQHHNANDLRTLSRESKCDMSETKSFSIRRATGKVFQVIAMKPALVVPFLLSAIVYLFILTLLYFAPQKPLDALIGIPITKFMGENYLKYPNNFTMIMKLMQKSITLVVATLGVFLTAYALWMLRALFVGRAFKVWEAIQVAFKKYIGMVLVFVVVYFLVKFLSKVSNASLVMLCPGRDIFLIVSLIATFFFAALVQSVFFFVFPSMVIGERSLIRAIRENLQMLQVHFFSVFFMVLIITFIGIVPAFLKMFTPAFIRWSGGYEVVLVTITIGIFFNVLTDIFITLLSGVLYHEIVGANQLSREEK